MYIQLTVDLKNYSGEVFDLQLSNYLSIKKVIEVIWQVKNLSRPPREGYWIRIQNKKFVCSGNGTLLESGITNGDRIEIL
ncbi:EsaB/YukD family protein [Peribacillus sp. B-H-3]|uniref:EsaB/YukD family protein n=1 Tax=Peribacillus sp. B-H-3 TaxID=3400420 RepID=UPI003B024DD0